MALSKTYSVLLMPTRFKGSMPRQKTSISSLLALKKGKITKLKKFIRGRGSNQGRSHECAKFHCLYGRNYYFLNQTYRRRYKILKKCRQGLKFKKISLIDSARRALQKEYHIIGFYEFCPWPSG